MITWRDGRAILAKHYEMMRLPAEVFLQDIAEYSPQRTTGTAVFMSISPEGIPHTLLHHLKHNEALHERVLLLSILSAETPTVPAEERCHWKIWARDFESKPAMVLWNPRICGSLKMLGSKACRSISTPPRFSGPRNPICHRPGPMAQWRKQLFIFMSRNAWNATSFFKLPPDRVVELGNQVEL